MTRTFCFNLPDTPASSSNPSYLQHSSWQETCKLPLFPLLFSCECLIQARKNSAPTNLSCCRERLPKYSHLGNVSINTYGLDYPRIYFCCNAMLLWICSFLSCSAKKNKKKIKSAGCTTEEGEKAWRKGSLMNHLESDESRGGNRKELWVWRRVERDQVHRENLQGQDTGILHCSLTKGYSKIIWSASQPWLFCPS